MDVSRTPGEHGSHYLPQAGPAPCRLSPLHCLTDGNNGSLSRSIRKITLSRQNDGGEREGPLRMGPGARASQGNCNNNNSRGLRHFSPDAMPCDWSTTGPREPMAAAYVKFPGSPCDSTQSNCVRTAPSSESLLIRGRRPSLDSDSLIAQLSLDIKQAESWVRRKLQDLNDQCEICPLQERGTQSIEGDIEEYESTIMTLRQMGYRLSGGQSANAASIQSQLQALRDQWQLLKQTATNQNEAVYRAKALLEYNKKADELEIWMREKEESPPLSVLLDQNSDKMQLTRRILDLKQDQLYYHNLQETINSLAQKLEKQGWTESKGASTRRKHLNRMWLRLQNTLEEHHQNLRLALEASSLWQLADTILRAMEEKRSSAAVKTGDQDVRDIASQIMMMDITVSQVSSLHPVLASKALHMQRRVKENWAQLQQLLRSEKPSRVSVTRERVNSVTSVPEEKSSMGSQQQRMLGSAKEYTNNRDFNSPNPLHSAETAATSRRQGPSLIEREQMQSTQRHHQQPPTSSNQPEVTRLLEDLSSNTQFLQSVELLLSEPTAMRSPEVIRRDLRQVSVLEKEVRSRGLALHCLGAKSKRLRVPEWTVNEETHMKVLEVEERFQIVQDALQRRASDLRDTLVLSEFMKVVQMEEEKKKKETSASGEFARPERGSQAAASDVSERFTPLEDLQEAVEMLNDAVKERERAVAASEEMTNLESRLPALLHMMESARARLQEVGRQIEAEEQSFAAVKKQTDVRDLREMFIEQQQIETDVFGAISEELRKLDEGRVRLRELCPTRSQNLGRSIEETLKTSSSLQDLLRESQARLQRTARLREFFLSYLGMISWTEDMRAQVLLEIPGDGISPSQREELESSIEGKLKEYEVLAGIGWKLIGEDPLLAQTIKERLEELQGMLSWVLMRWRCQNRQRIVGNKTQRLNKSDCVELPAMLKDELNCTNTRIPPQEFHTPKDEDVPQTLSLPRGPTLRRYKKKALSPMSFQHPLGKSYSSPDTESEDGAELQEDSTVRCIGGPLWLEPKVLPTVSDTPEPEQEPLMVSHMKDSESHICQSLTVPQLSRRSRSSEPFSFIPTNSSSSDTLPKNRSHLHFKSFKRKDKTQRLTVQGIMGVYSNRKLYTEETIKYHTYTWPPKQERKAPALEPHQNFDTFLNYVKNPLTKHIDAECVESEPVLKLSEVEISKSTTHSSHQHLTSGSFRTLQLTNELHFSDKDRETTTDRDDSNISDCGMAKAQGAGNKEPAIDNGHCDTTIQDTQASGCAAWIEALATSSGYCRQNIHGYGKSDTVQTQELDRLPDDFIHFEMDRLLPIVLQKLEPEWAPQSSALHPSKTLAIDLPNCRAPNLCYSDHSETGVYTPSTLQEKGGDIKCTKAYTNNAHEQPRSQRSSTDFLNTDLKGPSDEPYGLQEPQSENRMFIKVNPHSFPEVLHPDHEFLEHDDEELEGIWNNARKAQLGCSAPISQTISPKEMVEDSTVKHTEPRGQVVMTAQPNLLVATFTLPSNAVLATNSVKEMGTDPWGERSICQSTSEAAASTECYVQRGDDILSVQSPLRPKLENAEQETKIFSTTWKLDFQLMEGSLEKKHILQPGGKKASSRTWGLFYAVLVRRTFCFYHDRKHSTKSTVSSPPLHLTGAVCTPESDYVKRSNCFRLRLLDGSEYLFRAPSAELLQEWVSKVRHNSGMEDTDLLGDSVLSPVHASRIDALSPWTPDARHLIAGRCRERVEPQNASHDCRASTSPRQLSIFHGSESIDLEQDSNVMTSRRRSQSFSSVLYQKVAAASRPQETSPSYSVTLYIEDPQTPRGRSHSFATSYGSAHTGLTGDLKPRNKSVFRKLFRKKE